MEFWSLYYATLIKVGRKSSMSILKANDNNLSSSIHADILVLKLGLNRRMYLAKLCWFEWVVLLQMRVPLFSQYNRFECR